MNRKTTKTSTLDIQGTSVAVSPPQGDCISLTDMLRAKDGDFFISDWLRNRNTVEFLGIWESICKPAFNYGEFATIKSQAGLNSYKISVKEWVEKTGATGLKVTAGRYGCTYAHPDTQGNQRDNATLEQLVVRTNLESLNAVFIRQELPAPERLHKLNGIAISQMRSLLADHNVKRLAP
jgi:hypothetical protein